MFAIGFFRAVNAGVCEIIVAETVGIYRVGPCILLNRINLDGLVTSMAPHRLNSNGFGDDDCTCTGPFVFR